MHQDRGLGLAGVHVVRGAPDAIRGRAMLDDHLRQFPASSDGFVFTSAEGGPVWHRNFYGRHFKPAVVAAGLTEELRVHDLRHSCAALLIQAGRHIEEVKQYLGHSSIRVTSDRYGHLFPSGKESMRAGLEGLFAASRGSDLDSNVDQALTNGERKGSDGKGGNGGLWP